MEALGKTCQKESALGKYLYWEKIKKLSFKKSVLGELPEKLDEVNFGPKSHLNGPKKIQSLSNISKVNEKWKIILRLTFYILSTFNFRNYKWSLQAWFFFSFIYAGL